MALVGHTEVGIAERSQGVTVAENPRSRLMYYLHCITSLLGLNDDPVTQRLTQFDRPNLTENESDALLAYCYLLSPDVLLDKVIFHNEELCGDSNNKFFELSVAQTRLAVLDSILIGGERRQVQKVMLFKLGWIDKFWADPMKALAEERKATEERKQKKKNDGCCIIL